MHQGHISIVVIHFWGHLGVPFFLHAGTPEVNANGVFPLGILINFLKIYSSTTPNVPPCMLLSSMPRPQSNSLLQSAVEHHSVARVQHLPAEDG